MALEGRRAKENKNSERPSQWQKRVENWQIHLVFGADALSSILPMSTRCAAWDATTMTYFSQLTSYSLWTQTPQHLSPLTRGVDSTHAQMCVHSSPWLISILLDQITPANCLRHPVVSLCVYLREHTLISVMHQISCDLRSVITYTMKDVHSVPKNNCI